MKSRTAFAFISLALCCASTVSAVAIDMVAVGRDGRPQSAGSVAYTFRIGEYEISEQMIDKAWLQQGHTLIATSSAGLVLAALQAGTRRRDDRQLSLGDWSFALFYSATAEPQFRDTSFSNDKVCLLAADADLYPLRNQQN